ncbi:hypothetical protein [Rhodococcus rhodochrous]|uniref:hypothetical protein n=1 Tax=Rhodococcus rhodochrous TaxID=1829 RepID=UPI00037A154F|nr:hypothetical protein [Rhodococcus rhodochrous]
MDREPVESAVAAPRTATGHSSIDRTIAWLRAGGAALVLVGLAGVVSVLRRRRRLRAHGPGSRR